MEPSDANNNERPSPDANPFQSPASELLKATDGVTSRSERNWKGFWLFLGIAAVLEFVAAFLVEAATGPMEYVVGSAYLVIPVFALLFSSGYFMRLGGTAAKLIFKSVLMVMASACGYVCFAVSCSVTNMATGVIDLHRPPSNFTAFAAITTGAMCVACAFVALICRANPKRSQGAAATED